MFRLPHSDVSEHFCVCQHFSRARYSSVFGTQVPVTHPTPRFEFAQRYGTSIFVSLFAVSLVTYWITGVR